MESLARAAQQGAVGGVLDQRVLEQIFGRRRNAALEDEARFDEAAQRFLQFRFGELRGRRQQLMGKIAADGGTDLRHSLGRRTEPVEAPQQRGVQGGRHGERRRRHGGYRRIAAIGTGLDHSLGQFLDKERHPVGALDDLVDNIRRQCPEIAGEPTHERRPFAAAEPVQRDHRHLRPSDPGWLELGAVGCNQQHRHIRDPLDSEVEQLARGRIDPMQVLEDHQ